MGNAELLAASKRNVDQLQHMNMQNMATTTIAEQQLETPSDTWTTSQQSMGGVLPRNVHTTFNYYKDPIKLTDKNIFHFNFRNKIVTIDFFNDFFNVFFKEFFNNFFNDFVIDNSLLFS